MSRGTNMAVLIGHAGSDAERRTNSAALSIATNEIWKDRETGENRTRTEWHRLKFFGKLAEVAAEFVTKGTQLYVRGRLRTDRYTDREGIERYSTEVVVDEFQLLGGARREAPDDTGTDE